MKNNAKFDAEMKNIKNGVARASGQWLSLCRRMFELRNDVGSLEQFQVLCEKHGFKYRTAAKMIRVWEVNKNHPERFDLIGGMGLTKADALSSVLNGGKNDAKWLKVAKNTTAANLQRTIKLTGRGKTPVAAKAEFSSVILRMPKEDRELLDATLVEHYQAKYENSGVTGRERALMRMREDAIAWRKSITAKVKKAA